MKDRDEFMNELMRRIAHLPPEKMAEELTRCISIAVHHMDLPTVREFRAELLKIEHDGSIIDMVDGHIAIREMMETE